MVSHTTSIFPSDDRVIFVSLLNCTEFSTRLSEVAQTLDAISGIRSWSFAGGSARRGFLARSESAAAPGYDSGGCGALRSLEDRITGDMGHCRLFLGERQEQRPSVSLLSPREIQHRLEKNGRLVQTAQS